jgi:serine/threonine-protein kinase HipA
MERRMVVKKTRLLHVLMNGFLVGRLEKQSNTNMSFTYDTGWLNTPEARPISLSLPLTPITYTSDRVYYFFDNLLPDNFNIRGRVQSLFQLKSNHPFDLLACIGKDCIGAIQLIEGDVPAFKKTVSGIPLSDDQIANTLHDINTHPLGMSDDNIDFRISIAGAQEKCGFLYHENQWQLPLATTPTTHIFKLPIGQIHHQALDLSESCENEWLCAKITEAFKLPVAKCDILQFNKMKVLAVERFDRKLSADKKWIMRLPQEDMCQALGFSSHLKYQSDGGPGIAAIMKLLLDSEIPAEDRDTFYRAQILFWLLAAIDGHAKNFSLFIQPEGRYQLTPLYDIISAYPMMATGELPRKKVKMAMALKGKNHHYHWQNIQHRHFIHMNKLIGYSSERTEKLLDDMLDQVEMVIEIVQKQLPKKFPEHISIPIFNGMRAMKKQLER